MGPLTGLRGFDGSGSRLAGGAPLEQHRPQLRHGPRPLGVPDLEAGVDGGEEVRPVVALGGLRRRRHVVLVDAQRGFLGRFAR